MINIIVYIGILIYASIYDWKYLIVQNRVHIIIVILTIMSGEFRISNLIGAIFITTPILLLSMYKNLIGGGDIKFIFMNTLYCGFTASYFGIIVGLIIAVLYAFVGKLSGRYQSKSKSKIPLIPFLSIGYLFITILRVTVGN